MYHSYQPYTGNTGLCNCILGMGNLTACAHVPVKYGTFWKIMSWPENQGFFFFLYFPNIANEPDIFHGFPPSCCALDSLIQQGRMRRH